MSELPVRPSRVDFEKVDLNQIQRILSTGTLDSLRPEEREYFSLMEMVRGLRARMRFTNGRMVTKAGIIRLLKSEPYSLSDWMARQVYNDSINFSIPRTTSVRRRLLPCMPSVPRSGRTPLFWPARSKRQGLC